MLQAIFGRGSPTGARNSSQERQNDHLSLRILTHNIRFATSSPLNNERPWKERFPLIMNQFRYHTRFVDGACFICMQEVLYEQLSDILGSLNRLDSKGSKNFGIPSEGPFWKHIGVAREDGKTKGEYSPILYQCQHFTLLHFENTWLSPTPDVPSKGWDAGSERILTAGVFEHKITKRRFAVFNTHLDNAGTEARENSIVVIINVIERVRSHWNVGSQEIDLYPNSSGLDYFLAGDFNSFPTQEAYKAILASHKMVDVYTMVPQAKRYGSETTFTGFQPDTDQDKDEIGRIDCIWLGPKSNVSQVESLDSTATSQGWRVEGYSVLPNVNDDGVFCSDHRCVVADVNLVLN